MFGFFKRWRDRKILQDRFIYQYFDGEKTRYGDPARIWRELQNNGKVDLDNVAPLVDELREPETTLAVEAVAAAFQVQRWDEAKRTGLTDWEVLNLLWEMQSFMLQLKKNISFGQTLPEPMVSPSSNTQELPPETTNACSGCGCAADESKPSEPTLSEKE